MSKTVDALLADMMNQRWSVTEKQTNATITSQVTAPPSLRSTHVLDAVSIAVTNFNAAGFTVTATVRDASVAGDALAQWVMFVPASTTAQINPARLGIRATKGKGVFFTTDTVLGSVTASVNATGWTTTGSDY